MPDDVQAELRELRDIIQEALAAKDCRMEANTKQVQLQAIAAYVALAAVAGGIVLWMADSRIDQGTRRLSDKQIRLESDVTSNRDLINRFEIKVDKGFEEIKAMIVGHTK